VGTVGGLDRALALPGVTHAVATAVPGDRITLSHSFRDRVAYVIATGATGEAAARRADAAIDAIDVRIDARSTRQTAKEEGHDDRSGARGQAAPVVPPRLAPAAIPD
jgi:biotin carboxylase